MALPRQPPCRSSLLRLQLPPYAQYPHDHRSSDRHPDVVLHPAAAPRVGAFGDVRRHWCHLRAAARRGEGVVRVHDLALGRVLRYRRGADVHRMNSEGLNVEC